jgi:hypothetical protein
VLWRLESTNWVLCRTRPITWGWNWFISWIWCISSAPLSKCVLHVSYKAAESKLHTCGWPHCASSDFRSRKPTLWQSAAHTHTHTRTFAVKSRNEFVFSHYTRRPGERESNVNTSAFHASLRVTSSFSFLNGRYLHNDTLPPIRWVPGTLFPGVNRPRREADHSSPSSAEVKMCGAIPPLSNTSSRRGAQWSTGTTLPYSVVIITHSKLYVWREEIWAFNVFLD